jgi:hypothetical protein
MKRRHGVIEQIVRVAIPIACSPGFPRSDRATLLGSRLPSRPLSGAHDPIACRG